MPTKVRIVKNMVFPVLTYRCECWTIKKTEHQKTDAFELQSWKRLFRFPWTARRSNQSILKEINPEYSLEGLMLKLRLQYFLGIWCEESICWKRPWCWERLTAGGEGDDRGWDVGYYWLDGHEFEQAPGAGEGQGSLLCRSPWSRKELDTTESLNWLSHQSATVLLRSSAPHQTWTLPPITPPVLIRVHKR